MRLEDRQIRLPPQAKSRVEEAKTWLDQALGHQRRVLEKLTHDPTGAAQELAGATDLTHLAIRKLDQACWGRAGAEEIQTASTANADRSRTNQ